MNKLRKPAALLAHLEKAVAYDSTNADINYELGKFFNAQKQFSAAQPYLQKAIAWIRSMRPRIMNIPACKGRRKISCKLYPCEGRRAMRAV